MKKFDVNLLLNLYIPFYMAFLLKDFASLIVVIPVTFMLYRNLKKTAITPMMNYLIMLISILLIFLFGQRAHSAIILLTSFVALYIFNGEETRFTIGSIFLITLAAISSQQELYVFLPIVFLFTIRELKSMDIKFGKLTILIIIMILLATVLMPNYNGFVNNKAIVNARTGNNTTNSATYVSKIYNITSKESTATNKRLAELHKTYNTIKKQEEIQNTVLLIALIVAAGIFITLIYKYTRISGSKTFILSIILAIIVIALIGFGFYEIVSGASKGWKYLKDAASTGVGGKSTNFHTVTKTVNIKALVNKLTSLKAGVYSRYVIILEMLLAIVVLFIFWKMVVNVNTKKKKIDVNAEELKSKKEWFKNYGLSSDIFKLYSRFRDSFPRASLTPREFGDFFLDNYGLEIKDITILFEKARYSGEDLSDPEKKKFINKVLKIIDKLIE
jgi:hypothetical protein